MADTNTLSRSLAASARPARRLAPAWRRTLIWLASAVVVIAVLVLHHGLRPDLAARLHTQSFLLEELGSISTAILAAVAAFQLALPDRSRRWWLLPAPGLALWLFSMGYGCWADWLRLGPAGFELGTSWACMKFIAMVTVPLAVILFYLLRHAAPIRPAAVVLVGTLSISALAASGQSLVHGLDTTVMILIWHFGTIGVLLLLARLGGPSLLAWMLPQPAVPKS
jgi:hypothetical protein